MAVMVMVRRALDLVIAFTLTGEREARLVGMVVALPVVIVVISLLRVIMG
jgi:hypothetical protein